MGWCQSGISHLSGIDTAAVGCWWQFFLQQSGMNINLLISMMFPWKLVVPYPATQKNCFWVFWHLLTSESVWLLKGGTLGDEAARFLSYFWSHKPALTCCWPEPCVLPSPAAPVDVGVSHPQILYQSNSPPRPCHPFVFLVPGCCQMMATEGDLLPAVYSLSWRAETCSVLSSAEGEHILWVCWWANASRDAPSDLGLEGATPACRGIIPVVFAHV